MEDDVLTIVVPNGTVDNVSPLHVIIHTKAVEKVRSQLLGRQVAHHLLDEALSAVRLDTRYETLNNQALNAITIELRKRIDGHDDDERQRCGYRYAKELINDVLYQGMEWAQEHVTSYSDKEMLRLTWDDMCNAINQL